MKESLLTGPQFGLLFGTVCFASAAATGLILRKLSAKYEYVPKPKEHSDLYEF